MTVHVASVSLAREGEGEGKKGPGEGQMQWVGGREMRREGLSPWYAYPLSINHPTRYANHTYSWLGTAGRTH